MHKEEKKIKLASKHDSANLPELKIGEADDDSQNHEAVAPVTETEDLGHARAGDAPPEQAEPIIKARNVEDPGSPAAASGSPAVASGSPAVASTLPTAAPTSAPTESLSGLTRIALLLRRMLAIDHRPAYMHTYRCSYGRTCVLGIFLLRVWGTVGNIAAGGSDFRGCLFCAMSARWLLSILLLLCQVRE